MEPIATAIIIHSWDNIEYLRIRIPEERKEIVKSKLKVERNKIISILKGFYYRREIGSVKRPKNKKIQKQLDNLVRAKRDIDKTLKFIKTFYHK